MLGYIVITRKRFESKPEVANQGVSPSAAEGYAWDLYHDLQLDMVMVAEVNKDALTESGLRYRKIMKIERTCKHPNIQGELFEGGKWVCMSCGMVFKPEPEAQKVSSIIEQTTPALA